MNSLPTWLKLTLGKLLPPLYSGSSRATGASGALYPRTGQLRE